jgi:hypothetical protein
MIKISHEQMALIEKATTVEFIYRVIDIMHEDCPHLVGKYEEELLVQFLTEAMEEANEFGIESEKDVYDYMVLALKEGLGFLQHEVFAEKMDWYKSPYVPSVRKIEEINNTLTPPIMEEQDND